jgi:hypothetical protein
MATIPIAGRGRRFSTHRLTQALAATESAAMTPSAATDVSAFQSDLTKGVDHTRGCANAHQAMPLGNSAMAANTPHDAGPESGVALLRPR